MMPFSFSFFIRRLVDLSYTVISIPARFFVIGTMNDYSYNRPTVKPVHEQRNSEEEGALGAEEECGAFI